MAVRHDGLQRHSPISQFVIVSPPGLAYNLTLTHLWTPSLIPKRMKKLDHKTCRVVLRNVLQIQSKNRNVFPTDDVTQLNSYTKQPNQFTHGYI